MAPADSDEDALWPCMLCANILLDPVTLPCCGQSFCQQCVRGWVSKQCSTMNKVRCPYAGCTKEISCRLPPVSCVLRDALDALARVQIEHRRQEEAEEAGAEAADAYFGFSKWQEVAASRDLYIGDSIVVAYATSGIVIDRHGEDRLKVKFDERLVGQGALNVTPQEICAQLPSYVGFAVGQRVAASQDLIIGQRVVVPFAAQGTVLRAFGEDRLTVRFDDHSANNSNLFNVTFKEVQPYREYVGGFRIGDRVRASKDLYAEATLLIYAGALGIVQAEYSDTRLTVRFEQHEDGRSHRSINLTPSEVERVPQCEVGWSWFRALLVHPIIMLRRRIATLVRWRVLIRPPPLR